MTYVLRFLPEVEDDAVAGYALVVTSTAFAAATGSAGGALAAGFSVTVFEHDYGAEDTIFVKHGELLSLER